MAWCRLVLKKVEDNIVNKNKHLEDLRNMIKALQAQVDKINKAHTSALSDLSRFSKEKKNLEATLSNQEESLHALTYSLASAKEEVKKKDEDIATLHNACKITLPKVKIT